MKGVQKHSVLSLPLFCKSTVVLKNYTKSFMAPPSPWAAPGMTLGF